MESRELERLRAWAVPSAPPLVELDNCGPMPVAEAQQLVRMLEANAVEAARRAAYIEARCVDRRSHADAVKAQNRLATKVRRALGFTYPKQDVSF